MEELKIGNNIKKLREFKGLSREYVAKKIGKNLTYYGNIERGQNDPPVSMIIKIATILNVSPSEIIGFTDRYNLNNVQNSQIGNGNSYSTINQSLILAIENLCILLKKITEKI
jgi:transcriptional regulator with XRE-family HTH domain